MRRWAPLALAGLAAYACAAPLNYLEPTGPRYALPGGPPPGAPAASPVALRVVSFNVQYAQQVDRAIELLADTPLGGADLVLLQEMDAPGAERVARALGMGYVYYPATVSPTTRRDFGNAVLSRWPIVSDQKILLPHRARLTGTARAATAATIQVGGSAVRVYSVHLGSMAEIGPGSRREQLSTVLADAARFPVVVIGGDLNDHGVGRLAVEDGFLWPTEQGPRTASLGRWDHIFLKGLVPANGRSSGTVRETRGASDHRPVWTRAVLGVASAGSL